MATIKSTGSGANNGGSAAKNNGKSMEQLEKEFNEVVTQIRTLLKGRKDKTQIPTDEHPAIKSAYINASQLAREIARRTTSDETKEKYDMLYNKLSKQAQEYGSLLKNQVPTTTFDDVKGLDNVKKMVMSFLFMAQNPELVSHYKLKGGLGMLMYGAPGTGKTMFAEAIANAMNLPLFIVTPADIFKSYVGQSEQAVKQLFEEIDACPDGAILFIDECESIFSARSQGQQDYKAAVTTELLQRINGFGVNGAKRIMIAATNRPEMIDKAYLRYKRFSHKVHIAPPDEVALKSIIHAKLSGIELEGITEDDIYKLAYDKTHSVVGNANVGMAVSAKQTAWYSAADISGIVEEACRIALERLQNAGATKPIPLTREMFESAFNKMYPSITAAVLAEYENFH